MSTATYASEAPVAPRTGLHYGLWTVQVLLAFAFGMAGFMKSTTPVAELGAMMPWAADSPAWLIRFVGISELLGAIGLILPSALRILPKLTALAAAGLATIMVLAVGMHAFRGEAGIPVNLVLLGLAAFVAWGRFSGRPIAAR